MKNLVVVAHPDDEVFAMAGTISKKIGSGEQVHIVYCAQRVVGNHIDPKRRQINERSIEEVCYFLGCTYTLLPLSDEKLYGPNFIRLINFIETQVDGVKPTHLWTHWGEDFNQDHRAVSEACEIATRRGSVPNVIHFEVPSATENSPRQFSPNLYVNLSEENMRAKDFSIAKYKSELTEFRNFDTATKYAAYRALQGGASWKFAEAFKIVRFSG